ncbi:MAG: Dihydroorotase [Candidatus Magasanikbacteria bacterium GW2011_GWA2_56_11]|uniref:Dihydroorotase n=1 Tax=Candidatus Magasanikbacteria bacterium GW2011_GWA2_56_11 TaxID=1619044 RepID=A0A0G1YHI9_9BACT|nr:MAG: Dihydroorotase [Candidatus Magasanikbacteria bacterium GW2011_GWA2_56_11]
MTRLLTLPALIDPHVHFRVPGAAHKEDWASGARAALSGGVTTVLDMPNNDPPVISRARLYSKRELIESQLQSGGLPLRYRLYFGATEKNWGEFKHVKNEITAVKLFMGSSTGGLTVADEETQRRIFAECARLDILLAVHAEDEAEMARRQRRFPTPAVADHSRIRGPAVALRAVQKALNFARDYGTRLYILHVSTKAEVAAVRAAKRQGLRVYAEATPHHLFLNVSAYSRLGTQAQMNPPLRQNQDQAALWDGIHDGTIDTVGTDHAPHTLSEKTRPYGEAPSGVPGIETALPLLVTALEEGRLAKDELIRLTRTNPERIFRLPPNDDTVTIDLDDVRPIEPERLKTKCAWSPFAGWQLRGFPVAVTCRGRQHDLSRL